MLSWVIVFMNVMLCRVLLSSFNNEYEYKIWCNYANISMRYFLLGIARLFLCVFSAEFNFCPHDYLLFTISPARWICEFKSHSSQFSVDKTVLVFCHGYNSELAIDKTGE